MSEIIVGIDLGTTNSEIAIIKDGKIVVIEDAGRKILPSFVGVGENNDILVGEPAKNQYVLYPERTVKSIKRRMGEEIKVEMAEQAYTPHTCLFFRRTASGNTRSGRNCGFRSG